MKFSDSFVAQLKSRGNETEGESGITIARDGAIETASIRVRGKYQFRSHICAHPLLESLIITCALSLWEIHLL